MKAFNVIFKSGTSAVLYGKTDEEALASLDGEAEIDAVIDVIENLEREKAFKQEHESLMQSIAILDAIQRLKCEKDGFAQADAQSLLPKEPGPPTGLAVP